MTYLNNKYLEHLIKNYPFQFLLIFIILIAQRRFVKEKDFIYVNKHTQEIIDIRNYTVEEHL